jgi:hypothetical protein
MDDDGLVAPTQNASDQLHSRAKSRVEIDKTKDNINPA